jgi:hypothetical protein
MLTNQDLEESVEKYHQNSDVNGLVCCCDVYIRLISTRKEIPKGPITPLGRTGA